MDKKQPHYHYRVEFPNDHLQFYMMYVFHRAPSYINLRISVGRYYRIKPALLKVNRGICRKPWNDCKAEMGTRLREVKPNVFEF